MRRRFSFTLPHAFACGLAVVLLAAGCATPMAPTGGPVDRTPPELVAADPAPDSVNVRTDRLQLLFSKPVDEATLRQAVTITPDFERPPEVIVRGRRAEILFPEDLRLNTTYVVTIGTELRDLRQNALAAPITLAFATGPQLDQGRIEGVVRDPRTGAGAPGIDLFAYVLPEGAARADTLAPETLPDPRTARPAYRAQTDAQGRFQLDYLGEAPYFVVAVEDLNRNRRADPGEAFGAPLRPAVRAVSPEDTAAVPVLDFFVTRLDTIPPEPLRVRPRTRTRIAVRFTEPVLLREADPAAFALADSARGTAVSIEAVYADDDPFQIVLRTAPMEPTLHRLQLLRPTAVVDSAGNAARPLPLTFTAVAAPDDVPLTVLGFEPTGPDTVRVLRPRQSAAVRFSEAPPPAVLQQQLAVLSPQGQPLPFATETEQGVRVRVRPEVPGPFEVQVRLPDSTYAQRFRPLPADSLGELRGRVLDAPPQDRVIVEARVAGGDPIRVLVADDGSFLLDRLPRGEVTLRVFVDLDGSGLWDGGQLAPYRAPEPLRLLPPVRVRPRWETELEPIRLEDHPVTIPTLEPPPVEPEEPPADLIDLPGSGG